MIRIGTILYGFCEGAFGRDSYADKRVEGIGADWVVARELNIKAQPVLAMVSAPEYLEAYMTEEA